MNRVNRKHILQELHAWQGRVSESLQSGSNETANFTTFLKPRMNSDLFQNSNGWLAPHHDSKCSVSNLWCLGFIEVYWKYNLHYLFKIVN